MRPISPLLGKNATSAGRTDTARRLASPWDRARTHIGIILTVGACVIALLWLTLIVAIKTERQAAIEDGIRDANNLSAASRTEVSQMLGWTSRAMDAVAARLRATRGNLNIYDWAKDYPLLAPGTLQAGIIGPNGVAISSTLRAHVSPVDVSDREYFRVHVDGDFHGVFISKPMVGRVTGQTTIQLSQRVNAADGTFLGVIVFTLVPGKLTTLHRSIDLGRNGMLVVAGASDHVIRALFTANSDYGGLGTTLWVPPPPDSGIDGAGTAQSFIRESEADHVTRLYSVRYVAGYPLLVAAALGLNDRLAPAAAHAKLLLAIGIIATLMLTGLPILLIAEIRRRTDREAKLRSEQARLAAEIQQGRQVQEQLRSGEARLRDFAEMASDWFWELDADLRVTSTGAEELSARGGDRSAIGKHPWDLYDISREPEIWANHKLDLLARRPFQDFRHSMPGADGSVRHISTNGVPVFAEDGAFLGYRGTGSDITAKVAVEEELRRSKELAEASNMAKSSFLANMSHELRTPLNAIIGFAELIHARKAGPITPEYVEWTGDILAGGRHLLDMINDVLELSRIEAGRNDMTDETVDLGRLVHGCLAMVRRQAETAQVRIDDQIPKTSAVVRADRRAVKQVVLNLLTNAVKFTPAEGVVSIRIEPGENGEMALVVADTGIGIPAAVLPELCKPFIQADASTSRTYGGTGLGLAISSKLMSLHGGSLDIASTQGEGTTVRVTFPAARVLTASEPATVEQ